MSGIRSVISMGCFNTLNLWRASQSDLAVISRTCDSDFCLPFKPQGAWVLLCAQVWYRGRTMVGIAKGRTSCTLSEVMMFLLLLDMLQSSLHRLLECFGPPLHICIRCQSVLVLVLVAEPLMLNCMFECWWLHNHTSNESLTTAAVCQAASSQKAAKYLLLSNRNWLTNRSWVYTFIWQSSLSHSHAFFKCVTDQLRKVMNLAIIWI